VNVTNDAFIQADLSCVDGFGCDPPAGKFYVLKLVTSYRYSAFMEQTGWNAGRRSSVFPGSYCLTNCDFGEFGDTGWYVDYSRIGSSGFLESVQEWPFFPPDSFPVPADAWYHDPFSFAIFDTFVTVIRFKLIAAGSLTSSFQEIDIAASETIAACKSNVCGTGPGADGISTITFSFATDAYSLGLETTNGFVCGGVPDYPTTRVTPPAAQGGFDGLPMGNKGRLCLKGNFSPFGGC